MLFKIAIVISVFTAVVVHGQCPVTEKPEVVIDCLGYIARGLYGVAVNGEEKNNE
jgi:hypothetical protein